MKNLFNFNDYLFDIVFEKNIDITVILSDRLIEILEKINHPVAEKLLNLHTDELKSTKVSFIDYDDDKKGNFTYLIPNKFKDILKLKERTLTDKNIETFNNLGVLDIKRLGSEDYYPETWTKFRTSTSINKVVNKLFPGKFEASGKPGEDLESFKNLFISERKKEDEVFERFDVVTGKDINKYYLDENYDVSNSSILSKSCMRYEKCQPYIDFYSDNEGVSLVVLYSDDYKDKIIGRALLWDIEYINDEKVDRKFMDRIYTSYDSDTLLFKDYAKKKGWLYKFTQDMNTDTMIVDDGVPNDKVLKTTQTFKPKKYYPYMDTMKYFYHNDGFLSNSGKYSVDYLFLEETDGTYAGQESEDYDNENMVYVDYYDNDYHIDDLIWCDLGEEYRLISDAIWLENFGEYATVEYIDSELTWSVPLDGYIYSDVAVESDYYGGEYIPDYKSILAYMEGAAAEDFDEIDNNDYYKAYVLERDIEKHGFIKYYFQDDWYFHPNDKKYFVLCRSLKDKENLLWAHKEWDKEDIFKWKGEYWLNDVGGQKPIDDLIGQLRMFDNKNNKI